MVQPRQFEWSAAVSAACTASIIRVEQPVRSAGGMISSTISSLRIFAPLNTTSDNTGAYSDEVDQRFRLKAISHSDDVDQGLVRSEATLGFGLLG